MRLCLPYVSVYRRWTDTQSRSSATRYHARPRSFDAPDPFLCVTPAVVSGQRSTPAHTPRLPNWRGHTTDCHSPRALLPDPRVLVPFFHLADRRIDDNADFAYVVPRRPSVAVAVVSDCA